ncbi:MarR family winged helix-turn-helix transcriptional regulator [Amnibacterium kyonggiense]
METDDAIRGIIDSFDRIFVGVRRTVRLAAAALGPDVQPAAWPVFREVIRSGPVQATTLVATLGMDKSAVSRHLKELREHGLVLSERDPADARIAWLSPTPLAHERLAVITEGQRERLHALFESWSAEDVERFSALLARFSDPD